MTDHLKQTLSAYEFPLKVFLREGTFAEIHDDCDRKVSEINTYMWGMLVDTYDWDVLKCRQAEIEFAEWIIRLMNEDWKKSK